jgi:hypothetical protein
VVRSLAAVVVMVLPFLPLAGLAAHSLSVPPNGISGCLVASAAGGIVEDDADVIVTPTSPDLLDVTVDATATDGDSFPGLYDGSFDYQCLLIGVGSLEYGSASGTLSLAASSTPDFLEGIGANKGNTFSNSGRADGEALLELQFDDVGTVVSDTLPNGTPVLLEFTYVLESTAVLTGAPPGPLLGATATYFTYAMDTTSLATADWILSGTDQETRPLATQVGRQIALRGRLQLRVNALAGREVPGALYYPDLDASIDASNTSHFTVEVPDDVSFVAESGHDYAAPEPGGALLLAAGALVLAAARRS